MSVSVQNQVVFVIGPPLAGRSTACQRFVQDFNFNHISISNTMKRHVEDSHRINIGNFRVRDQLIKIKVDGFPKTLEQAQQFEKKFGSIESILYLQCETQTIFHRKSSMTQDELNFEKRLEIFFENVKPIKDYYQIINKLYIINGNRDINSIQKDVVAALSPKFMFFLGAPNTGKKTCAKYLADKINYQYVDFDCVFKDCVDENQKVNVLINFMKLSLNKYFVFDSIFLSTKMIEVLIEFYTAPQRVFYLEADKDTIEDLIRKNTTDKKEREQKIINYQEFIKNQKQVLDLLSTKSYFSSINIENKSLQDVQKELMKLLHPQILVSHEGSNPQLQKKFMNQLQENGFINLNIPKLIQIEQIENNFVNKLKIIRKIIFRQPYTNKFILTDFSNILDDYVQLEKRVQFMITYVGEAEQELKPQNHFYKEGKLIKITEQINDISYLDIFLNKQATYNIIIGPPFCGKTTLCKYLKDKFGYNLAEYDKIIQHLKEKLGGEEGPLEEVPFDPFCKYLGDIIKNQKQNQQILFDGWNYGLNELNKLFLTAGNPQKIVCLVQSKENITKSFRKKKEMEESVELGEEDQKEIDNIIQKQKDYKEFFQKFVENNYYTQVYQFSIDGRFEKILQDSNKIFQKRVICVDVRKGDYQKYSQIFSNISQIQDFHFIDVQQSIKNEYEDQLKTQLSNEYSMRWTYVNQNYPSNYSPKLIMEIIKKQLLKFKSISRDIMLFGYPSADQSLQRNVNETYFPRITDEINEILQNFGPIRLLVSVDQKIHNDQERKYDDPIQEKVVKIVEEKKKINIEGDDEQPDEKADEDGEIQQKKWNFEDYSWTQSDGNSKNILKIYSKLFESNEFQNYSIIFKNEENILKQIQMISNKLNDGQENGFLVQIEDN